MRPGEILSMRWKDVDLTERFVHLPETKNSTSRDVPLSRKSARLVVGELLLDVLLEDGEHLVLEIQE
jgi:integrase